MQPNIEKSIIGKTAIWNFDGLENAKSTLLQIRNDDSPFHMYFLN